MAKNTPYRYATKGVEWKPSKWDGFHMIKTEHPYRHQKGSGRAECFLLAEDGLSIGEWTKRCAEKGFESTFAVGSLLKLQGAKLAGWLISPTDDQGRTLEQIKNERETDPEKAAAKAEEAAEKAKKREALAAEREAARAAKKAQKDEERALKDAAKRQADAEAATADPSDDNAAAPPAKKGRSKKVMAVETEEEAA